MATGVITIELPEGSITDVAINSGYVKVDESKVTCIVDGAVALKADDSDIAKKIEEATELLRSAAPSSVGIASAVGRVERMGKSI